MTAPTKDRVTTRVSKSGDLTITTPVETPKRAVEFAWVTWKVASKQETTGDNR